MWIADGCGLRSGQHFTLRVTRDVAVPVAPTPAASAPFAFGTGLAVPCGLRLGCGGVRGLGFAGDRGCAIAVVSACHWRQVLLRPVTGAAFAPVASTAPAAAAAVAGFALSHATFSDRHRNRVDELLHHASGADFVCTQGAFAARAAPSVFAARVVAAVVAAVVARRAGLTVCDCSAFNGRRTFGARTTSVTAFAVAARLAAFPSAASAAVIAVAAVAPSATALAASFAAFASAAIALVGGRRHHGGHRHRCNGQRGHCRCGFRCTAQNPFDPAEKP